MPYIKSPLKRSTTNKEATTPPFRLTGIGRAVLRPIGYPDLVVRFPFGPKDVKIDNIPAVNVEIERPGRKSILATIRPSLITLSFEAVIAHKGSGGANPDVVDDILEDLYTVASEGYECKFLYGYASYPYTFKITQLTTTEKTRNSDGRVIRANVSIQLTESAPYNPDIVQLDVVTFEPPVVPVVRSDPQPDPLENNQFWNKYVSQFGVDSKSLQGQYLLGNASDTYSLYLSGYNFG